MTSYMLYLHGHTVEEFAYMGPSYFTPYAKCHALLVKNFASVEQQLVYCPPVSIVLSDTQEVKVERFFLGQGDRAMNSAFVYRFVTGRVGRMVNLEFYTRNVYQVDTMRISKNDYQRISYALATQVMMLPSKNCKNRADSYFSRYLANRISSVEGHGSRVQQSEYDNAADSRF